jgi:orotidine 5''-phosphate decarboxylase, subfamily 1
MAKDVIIALDFPEKEEVSRFLSHFTQEKPYVKVGMELFYAEGPSILRELKEQGFKIFLDLKLHDIPNTVKSAMRVLSNYGVDIANLHAAGTIPMMEAAIEGLTRPDGSRPLLFAVTQLTSTNPALLKPELLIDGAMAEVAAHYAQNAKKAGLDGAICSPHESPAIHAACGAEFLTLTPGIRFADATADDQSRVTTPALARELGSDYIVVGRPITQASDPLAVYRRCMSEFVGG